MPHHSYAKRLLSLALVLSVACFFLKKKFEISFLHESLKYVVIPILYLIIINQSNSEGKDTNRNNARKNNSKKNEKQNNIKNEPNHQEEANPIKQHDDGKTKKRPLNIKQFYEN